MSIIKSIFRPLPIVCTNGIGDSLLILGRIPIKYMGRIGFRFQIYYSGSSHTRAILSPFLSSIDYCKYTSEPPSQRDCFIFSKLLSLSSRLRRIFKPPYCCPEQSNSQTLAAEMRHNHCKRILLHTHLDENLIDHGLTAKLWPLENWIELCHRLHENNWQISILEWNREMRENIFMQCPFVRDGRHSQECALYSSFSQYNCVFSVDSWSKYVAAWHRVPQVIVVPDLRVGYAGFDNISATQFATWWMQDILTMPNTQVLGLAKYGSSYHYSLASFSHLNVSDAFSAIDDVYQSSLGSRPTPY
jgi:hypothetical protein